MALESIGGRGLPDRKRYKPTNNFISHRTVRKLLSYDPDTGVFTWKIGRKKARKGDVAGTIGPDGYRRLCVDYHSLLAHRLAWFWFYGEWPRHQIDHINHDKDDNRVSNLRDVRPPMNALNRSGPAAHNKCGILGVRQDKRYGSWQAKITVNKKEISLGSFPSIELAAQARKAAEEKYYQQIEE